MTALVADDLANELVPKWLRVTFAQENPGGSRHVVSTEDLVIDGKVEGTIELGDHSLSIGPGAKVVADLAARSITISGTGVKNDFATADKAVRIMPGQMALLRMPWGPHSTAIWRDSNSTPDLLAL